MTGTKFDYRTNAQKHKAAAEEIDTALRALRRAHQHEGELEYGERVGNLIEELEQTSRRLKEYAANNW